MSLQFTHVPLLCLQRRVANVAIGFFYCWSLLRNNKMVGSLYITGTGVLLHETVERRHLGR